jgi:hypothetical protein
MSGDLQIDGYRLLLTCPACPEQYDVLDGTEQVGYLRLRHGYFRADAPMHGGETVYEAHTRGVGSETAKVTHWMPLPAPPETSR